jgi:TonB family protein
VPQRQQLQAHFGGRGQRLLANVTLAPDVPFLWRGSSETEEEFAMRSRWTQLAMSLAAVALLASGASAQQSNTDEGKRKVKSKTSPPYPELARRMNVSGKVKIEVIITPDGRVRSSRVIGGHPLLVQSCQDAVKEWKYFPAPEETTQVIEFDFRATN